MSSHLKSNKIITTLAKDTFFEGDMNFHSSVKIEGKYKGKITTTGFLYIDSTAIVNADIVAQSMVVAGVVNGNLEVKDRLELLSTAKIKGDVKTYKLRIADGVEILGYCKMLKAPEDVDIFQAPTEKLKETLKIQ